MYPNPTEVLSERNKNPIRWDFLIGVSLCVLVIAVYYPVSNFAFVNFDDPLYIYENEKVMRGLTLDGIRWAFKFSHDTYWHPLTWISHMLDCELFGVQAGMHHTVNLTYHLINTFLLFILFINSTGDRWKSFLIAGLFAVHPLCVDTVAWVAERKNLLSTTMFLLSLIAYVYYQRRQKILFYAGALIYFVLGLLAKPMLVTMSGVLILMDFWPLQRIRATDEKGQRLSIKQFWRQNKVCFYDKIPFILITIIYLYIFLSSIRAMGILVDHQAISWVNRLSNILVSNVQYLMDVLWPHHLAVYYPFPATIPLWQSIGAAMLLACITGMSVYHMRQYPWLTFGWFWFCGTLIPVSGSIQAGLWPARADRWLYVPIIGLLVCIVYGGFKIVLKIRWSRKMIAFIVSSIILSLSGAAHIQTHYWKDSETLFRRAISVTNNNYIAYDNLGLALVTKGRTREAHKYFEEALRINPNFEKAHHNIGASYMLQGDTEKAYFHILTALDANPMSERLHNNMGMIMMKRGQREKAIEHFRRALSIRPGFKRAEKNLQRALRVYQDPSDAS